MVHLWGMGHIWCMESILLLATKTDLTRESTAVLHSTLSIILVNINICWGSWPIVHILKLVLYNTRSNPVLNTMKLFFILKTLRSIKVFWSTLLIGYCLKSIRGVDDFVSGYKCNLLVVKSSWWKCWWIGHMYMGHMRCLGNIWCIVTNFLYGTHVMYWTHELYGTHAVMWYMIHMWCLGHIWCMGHMSCMVYMWCMVHIWCLGRIWCLAHMWFKWHRCYIDKIYTNMQD